MENLNVTSCLGYHSAPEYIKIQARFEKSIFLMASVINLSEKGVTEHDSHPNQIGQSTEYSQGK